MKNLLILVMSSLIISCGGRDLNLPAYPNVKDYYGISIKGKVDESILQFVENKEDVRPSDEVVNCLHFDLISFRPFKLKYTGAVELNECNLIGGFAPKDFHSVFNWFDDVYIWSTRYKCYEKTN